MSPAAIYCPLDGHVNSLQLFRALHAALAARGVDYRPNHPVEAITPSSGGFMLSRPMGRAPRRKVVLAAGLGNARLAPMVGLDAPVRPSKGQIIVTEKAAPFLHISHRDRAPDRRGRRDDRRQPGGARLRHRGAHTPVISAMADRAIRMFPLLAGLNVVRTWSALRVMSPDGFPDLRSVADAFPAPLS